MMCEAHWYHVVRSVPIVCFCVPPAALRSLDVTPDVSGLSELLNVAYAEHEIIADTTTQMLDWFEQQPVVGVAP